MANTAQEARTNVRVKANNYVSWRIENSNRAGEGKVRNISTSGMLLEMTANEEPNKDALFSFVSGLGMDNFIPQAGQLVWCKKKQFASNHYLCGVRFVQISESILAKLQQKVQDGLSQAIKSRQTEKISGIFVGAVFFILAGYVVWLSTIIYDGMRSSNDTLLDNAQQQAILTQTYSNLYHVTEDKLNSVTAELDTTKKLYEESQLQLSSVTAELQSTKQILTETQTMLNQAKSNNSQLKNEVQTVKDFSEKQVADVKATMERTVKALEDNNSALTLEVQTMREKLDYLSGNIKSKEEGKSLLALYSSRVKIVKEKINQFKREAQQVKVEATRQRDRLRASLGNNGYMTRNGETVKVDFKKYNAAGQAVEENAAPSTPQPQRKIQVDVDFFNN